jgi:hypothetical protein
MLVFYILGRRKGRGVMFVNMYLIGLLVGLGTYTLTFLFSKEMENPKRVIVLVLVGIVTLLESIFVIGGFEGMPYGVSSAGIFTIAILFSFFGKNTIWKKFVYTFVLLFIALYFAFTYINKVDYWIIKKHTFLMVMKLVCMKNNFRRIYLSVDIKFLPP